MAQCITCGAKLHPERAKKYDYCMAPECQEKNARGLTMVAIGMNKAADELMILDERTQQDMAGGKYRDQRRGSFGTSAAAPARRPANETGSVPERSGRRERRSEPARTAAPAAIRHPWTKKQERLALLYNEQGLRPDEIARKLGVSTYSATQIVLAARSRSKG